MEQSKKLAEFLPIETADMFWKNGASDKYFQCFTPFVSTGTNVDYDCDLPCWSLTALINILASNTTQVRIEGSSEHWFCEPLFADINKYSSFTDADNLVDACFDMIIRLKEKNLI